MQTNLIEEMRAEASRLSRAADILDGGTSASTTIGHGNRRGRHLSEAAKQRISKMMKKRWAERKREVRKHGGALALIKKKAA